jgi:hypothetical protein
MIVKTWVDHIPIWLLFLGAVAASLAALEGGYCLGRRRRTEPEQEKEDPIGVSVAASLGLFALLLAFVFGFSANRFDERRRLVNDEANAIGTSYLRAAMLPEPHRGEVRRKLREYVDVRINAVENLASLQAAIARSNEIQSDLWEHARIVAEKDARSIPYGLFIESLNLVIDLHSVRLTAGARTRLPAFVWTILFSLFVLSFSAMGYHVGLSNSTRSPALIAVAFAFALSVWLVVDLERPYEGSLKVSQQPMLDLQRSIAEPKTVTPPIPKL